MIRCLPSRLPSACGQATHGYPKPYILNPKPSTALSPKPHGTAGLVYWETPLAKLKQAEGRASTGNFGIPFLEDMLWHAEAQGPPQNIWLLALAKPLSW